MTSLPTPSAGNRGRTRCVRFMESRRARRSRNLGRIFQIAPGPIGRQNTRPRPSPRRGPAPSRRSNPGSENWPNSASASKAPFPRRVGIRDTTVAPCIKGKPRGFLGPIQRLRLIQEGRLHEARMLGHRSRRFEEMPRPREVIKRHPLVQTLQCHGMSRFESQGRFQLDGPQRFLQSGSPSVPPGWGGIPRPVDSGNSGVLRSGEVLRWNGAWIKKDPHCTVSPQAPRTRGTQREFDLSGNGARRNGLHGRLAPEVAHQTPPGTFRFVREDREEPLKIPVRIRPLPQSSRRTVHGEFPPKGREIRTMPNDPCVPALRFGIKIGLGDHDKPTLDGIGIAAKLEAFNPCQTAAPVSGAPRL